MAHSIQVFQGRYQIFNDLDLLPVVGMAVDHISRHPGQTGFRPIGDCWRGIFGGYGPGVIDLCLDSLAPSESGLSSLLELVEAVRKELRAFGATIPAPVLNACVGIAGVTFVDRQVKGLIGVAHKLENLLRGGGFPCADPPPSSASASVEKPERGGTRRWTGHGSLRCAFAMSDPIQPNAPELIEAVGIWTGWGHSRWPQRSTKRLADRYGEDVAARLLPLLESLERDFYSSDANLGISDLGEIIRLTSEAFKRKHPAVAEEVVKSFAWCYSYDFK